ncbi:MAG: hypothetical protein ACT4PP_03880 [Sporichthyaceae bacterium]
MGGASRTALAEIDAHELRARFGPWTVHTPLTNIKAVTVNSPYSRLKTAGPARLSVADRGLTMATTAQVVGAEARGALLPAPLALAAGDAAGAGLLIKQRGRNLRAGQASRWTEDWFHDQGLLKLSGTIRYPKAAYSCREDRR